MRLAAWIAVILLVALLTAIGWAWATGNGWAELQALLGYPWFVMSLVDIYAGFILFSMWVFYREANAAVALAWSAALMVIGNPLACVYVLLALARHRGDWAGFWMGARRTSA